MTLGPEIFGKIKKESIVDKSTGNNHPIGVIRLFSMLPDIHIERGYK